MEEQSKPVFNLVYFRQSHFRETDGGIGRKRFPVTPEEVIAGKCDRWWGGCSGEGTSRLSVEVPDILTLKTTLSLWRYEWPPLINAPTWSVHPGRVLLRLLSFLDLDDPAGKGGYRNIKEGNTYDLAETFHRPSIMTMRERVAFCTADVHAWLNIKVPEGESDPETYTLIELVRREVTKRHE